VLQVLIVICIILLDQGTKYMAQTFIRILPDQTIPVIKDVFHFTYAENRGAAFSILQNQRWLFIAVTIIAVIFIIYYLLKHPKENIILKISLSLILAGAIGNLIDRILHGYVVDFFDFRLINFAVFNVADSAVVIGSILLGYYLMFISDKDKYKIKNVNENKDINESKDEHLE
jgi:signal peptidase II